jgi:hypothetical protein
LVHHKQNLEGRLDAAKDGSDGSPIENETNAVARVYNENTVKSIQNYE